MLGQTAQAGFGLDGWTHRGMVLHTGAAFAALGVGLLVLAHRRPELWVLGVPTTAGFLAAMALVAAASSFVFGYADQVRKPGEAIERTQDSHSRSSPRNPAGVCRVDTAQVS